MLETANLRHLHIRLGESFERCSSGLRNGEKLKDRAKFCGRARIGTGEVGEPMLRSNGKAIGRTWYCHLPFCPEWKAYERKGLKELYFPRAASRVKYEYWSMVFKMPPDATLSLEESIERLWKAKNKFFMKKRVREIMLGGFWSMEVTREDRKAGFWNVNSGENSRSWYPHFNFVSDGCELGSKEVLKELHDLWNRSLGLGKNHDFEGVYCKKTQHFEKWFDYMTKGWEVLEWSDDEIDEAVLWMGKKLNCKLHFGAFGSWNEWLFVHRSGKGKKSVPVEEDGVEGVNLMESPVLLDKPSLELYWKRKARLLAEAGEVSSNTRSTLRLDGGGVCKIEALDYGGELPVGEILKLEKISCSFGKFFRGLRQIAFEEREFVGAWSGVVQKGSSLVWSGVKKLEAQFGSLAIGELLAV